MINVIFKQHTKVQKSYIFIKLIRVTIGCISEQRERIRVRERGRGEERKEYVYKEEKGERESERGCCY